MEESGDPDIEDWPGEKGNRWIRLRARRDDGAGDFDSGLKAAGMAGLRF